MTRDKLQKGAINLNKSALHLVEVRCLYNRESPKILVYVTGKLFFAQEVFHVSLMPLDMTLVAYFLNYVNHLLAKFGLVGVVHSLK